MGWTAAHGTHRWHVGSRGMRRLNSVLDGLCCRARTDAWPIRRPNLETIGFVDAFNPLTGWVDADVIGIDLGISMLMAENARSGFVWRNFMANVEVVSAMQKAGFRGA